jgi:hypothetical protein
MSPRWKGILCALAALLIAGSSSAQELVPATPADTAAAAAATKAAKPGTFGQYVPGAGFRIANTDKGSLNFRLYTYFRYLNQTALDETYTDSFGNVSSIQPRQDMQVNKVNLYFLGWVLDPKFRYLFYVWTSNTAQGNGAQVVVAGNVTYAFSTHATVGIGIGALPGVRSTEGNFPYWLGTDSRLIADTYFMPSYTTGLWSNGTVVDGLKYQVMLGNNLSQLGVDAGQLDETFNTWASSLVWMPTTKEYGAKPSFGDYERHDRLATRLGAHYTRSDEDRQSQPNTEAIENAQIRISDGNIVFKPGLFGPGISIQKVMYQMSSIDAGMKYKGLALEGEVYRRWVDHLSGTNTDQLPMDVLMDSGFQLQLSGMVVPKALQLYVAGSKIYGQYGDPSDVRFGANWFPWKNQVARWNLEVHHLNDSPVGALSLPYTVGGNGNVYHADFEVNF